jgi:hypothetical protein
MTLQLAQQPVPFFGACIDAKRDHVAAHEGLPHGWLASHVCLGLVGTVGNLRWPPHPPPWPCRELMADWLLAEVHGVLVGVVVLHTCAMT